MKLNRQAMELMGKKVDYCRTAAGEKGEPVLFRGKGVIVGIIIGVTKRIQIMVKDADTEQNKAYTLDLLCIDPTEEDAQAYFEHNQKIRAIVDEHNVAQKEREQEKIKEVDDLNYKFFGEPLEI